jgi:hypothetical protein
MKIWPYLLLAMFLMASCGDKKQPISSNVSAIELVIPLDSVVSSAGCLDAASYLQKIPPLAQLQMVQKISTNFVFPAQSVRSNFEKQMAYGSFSYQLLSPGEAMDFSGFAQSGCDTFTVASPGGAQQEFKLSHAARDSIQIDKDENQWTRIRWISPTMMEITERYFVYDLPCGSDKGVIAEFDRILAWSESDIPALIELHDSPILINEKYLSLVAEATGFPIESLYLKDEAGQRIKIYGDKLKEMAAMPLQEKFLLCQAEGLLPAGQPRIYRNNLPNLRGPLHLH